MPPPDAPRGLATIGNATIGDVAARAGVSIRTVSRVINGSPKVNAETRAGVQAVIDSLGFAPSARAQALASGRSRLIGVIQGDANAHVLFQVQNGIVAACAPSRHELIVHPAALSGEALVADLTGFVRRSRVDGVIVLSPTSEDEAVAPALARLGVPAVALASAAVPGFAATLVPRDRAGAAAVAEHLHALGHRRIALVGGPAARLSSRERVEGFRDALGRRGAALDPALAIEGDYGFASGVAAAERLLALPEPPSAIFCCNDLMAAGALKAAARRGVAVPRDLSIVGFDGTDLAAMLTPGLTTVDRPVTAIARRATELLLRLIAGDEVPAIEHFDVALVMRESTGPLMQHDS
ncbi:LacI family DNA-binding transcriptional regulator [Sphingomonas corticis]|jgi:LacI family transcriptional regulator|uniref:LacI family transcriptional regulator n=1 Tax=Sphingomonas corticis TaxID=2722791 RepID=A0ABX1CI59_9SPHN|nr:LacI family DNA-binding transcriptional regulator [Sphingomonas corticis]NJR77691.1 LacI family transcriptional regulator [Sphingomonas corticis]